MTCIQPVSQGSVLVSGGRVPLGRVRRGSLATLPFRLRLHRSGNSRGLPPALSGVQGPPCCGLNPQCLSGANGQAASLQGALCPAPWPGTFHSSAQRSLRLLCVSQGHHRGVIKHPGWVSGPHKQTMLPLCRTCWGCPSVLNPLCSSCPGGHGCSLPRGLASGEVGMLPACFSPLVGGRDHVAMRSVPSAVAQGWLGTPA